MSIAAAVLALLLAPQQPADGLAAQLARVVDLPAAKARRDGVAELLRKTASVDEWRAVCRTFGSFAAKEPGPTRQTLELQVLDVVEPVETFLYVPVGYDPRKPSPLLLWGHGAGGTGAREYLLWQQVADAVGMFVLAITANGKQPGWGFTARERAAQLAALRWARRSVNVDENAVFVGGWSQGGHMTWDLMLRHPDLFAGALPVVGGPRIQFGPNNNFRYLENVAHLPIRDLQGSQDDALLLVNLRVAFARLQKLGAKDAVLREFPDLGHSAELAAIEWPEFFTRRRVPVPTRVVRVAADPGETRSFWVSVTACDAKITPDVVPAVDAARYDALDETGRRTLVLDKYGDCTARLAVQDKGHGKFVAESRGVKSFALLLAGEQLGKDGSVEVVWQGRTVKKKVTPDATTLLGDFVERLDRTFSPVARVTVP